MTTYDFYQNVYLGSKLDQQTFPRAIARAEEYIAFLQRQYRVTPAAEDSLWMAACAVADLIEELQMQIPVSAATVGNVSVHYFAPDREGRLRRAVAPYLQIYRGVG